MSTKNKQRSRNSRRRPQGKNQSHKPMAKNRPKPPCAACGRIITDIITSLTQPNGGEPLHFDCALKIAVSELNPASNEKVVYIGNGGFAVVEQNSYQKNRLKIHRRVEWENPEERKKFLRELSYTFK